MPRLERYLRRTRTINSQCPRPVVFACPSRLHARGLRGEEGVEDTVECARRREARAMTIISDR